MDGEQYSEVFYSYNIAVLSIFRFSFHYREREINKKKKNRSYSEKPIKELLKQMKSMNHSTINHNKSLIGWLRNLN